MAKVKLRPEMTARADYEADFFASTPRSRRGSCATATPAAWTGRISPRRSSRWAGATAASWKAGFDWQYLHHLAEVARRNPGLRGRSWQSTLREQRREAAKLLEGEPEPAAAAAWP